MSFIPMRVSVGTISSVSGTTGTGAAGRVAYWQDATTLTSSASFTFDGTSLGVPDGAAATPAYTFASASNTGFFLASATRVDLSLGGSSIVEFSLYKVGVTATGANAARLTATAANTAGSSAFCGLQVLGGSGGDAYTLYSVFAVIDWYVGVDNSDSDSFKVGNGGLGTGNDFLTITSAGRVDLGQSGGSQSHRINGDALKFFASTSSSDFIFNDAQGSDGSLYLIGGANVASGSIQMYGSTHATKASVTEFKNGGNLCGSISSSGAWAFGETGATPTHRFNTATQTTVGAAGGASALPATPTGYWLVSVNGTTRAIPYYANA